jgi:hypothetical protein
MGYLRSSQYVTRCTVNAMGCYCCERCLPGTDFADLASEIGTDASTDSQFRNDCVNCYKQASASKGVT